MYKKYKITIISVIVITVILLLVNILKNGIKYRTVPLEHRTITQVVEASGTINPVNSISVGSTVSGLMQEIYVDFNSEVKKGQLIAKMDTSLFITDVDKTRAALATAKANYVKQQAITSNDKKTYVRCKNLYARNLMAKSELDLAESNYFADIAELNAAQAQIHQAEAAYNNAKTLMSYANILSPVDGIVIKRAVDVGQPVAASFQAPELFVIAQDLKKMQIEVNVSEADIGKIKEGQEVDYTLDGYPDSVFKGTVSQVRISPTTVSNVVTYTIIVFVNNDDLKLKPGMTANVSIIIAKKENALCVPNMALKFVPDADDKVSKHDTQGIWVLRTRKPKRIDVKLGVRGDSYTEVISNELRPKESVIISSTGGKSVKKPSNMPRRGPMGI